MAVSSAQVIVTAYYQRWGDMTIVRVTGVGQYGVNKDLSRHELPINVWTDARNIRFYGDSAYQFSVTVKCTTHQALRRNTASPLLLGLLATGFITVQQKATLSLTLAAQPTQT